VVASPLILGYDATALSNYYKLDFGGRQGVLHINQLRKFVERQVAFSLRP